MTQDDLQAGLVELVPALTGYARALTRNGSDAEDLIQETLARAIAHLDQFTPGTNLRSWVLRIERNLWFNEHQRRRREQVGFEADTHPGCCGPEQEWSLQHTDLMSAMDRLKPEHKDVLITVAAEGASYQEAAERADCEIGTVKSRLNRAREALAAELGIRSAADGMGPPPGPQPWHSWQTTVLR